MRKIDPPALMRHIVKGLARDHGLTVVRSNGFRINLQTKEVHLPPLPPDDKIAMDLVLGGAYHEVEGHFLYTDPSAKSDPNSEFHPSLIHSLTNAYEDVRIEFTAAKNCGVLHTRMNNFIAALRQLGHLGMLSTSNPFTRNLGLYVVIMGCCRVLKYPAAFDLEDDTYSAMRSMVGEKIQLRLDSFISRIPFLNSTQDCMDLAEETLRMVKDLLEQKSNDPQQSQQSSQQQNQANTNAQGDTEEIENAEEGESEDSDSDDSGSDDSESDNDDESNGSQSMDDSQQGEDDSSEDSDGQNQPGQSCQHEDDQSDLDQQAAMEMLKQLLNPKEDELDSNERTEKVFDAVDKISNEHSGSVQPFDSFRYGNGSQNPLIIDSASTATNALSHRLSELLRTSTKSKKTYRDSGRVIASRKLAGVAIGKTKIFQRKTQGFQCDTSIYVLLDASSSMDNTFDLAVQSCVSISLALEGQKGVEVSIGAFPCHNGDYEGVGVLKAFQERNQSARFTMRPYGSTPMSEAMMQAYEALYSRPTSRKILVVATDGGPDENASALAVVKAAPQVGVEVLGIGIQYDVSWLFPNSTVIQSIDELSVNLFQLLQDRLLRVA